MNRLIKTTLIFALSLLSQFSLAKDNQLKPNILWLTFEDTSAFELSSYGNKHIKNPNIDTLASSGFRFNRVSSNAPYCSPARSTIISGAYATTYGADHHRAPIQASAKRLFFPELLRQAGYFTSNNKKRDYNVKLSQKRLAKIWDEFDSKASYNSVQRQSKQPFFSVFNANITHMSRLTSHTLEGRRDFTQSGVNPAATPEYLPSLPEITSDHQFHLEGVIDIDTWVGLFIADLKAKGLYDNTIIFVFSDHGGSSPRGKGFLYQSTGLHVPFILHVPEQFKHLVPGSKTELVNKQLSFVDLAPTVLSLAGVAAPDEMQGQAFLGQFAQHNRPVNYAFRTNQEQHYDPQRGVTDGHYSYVKNYLPRKPLQLRNDFQWGMPGNIALDEFAKSREGENIKRSLYQGKQDEYLFDLTTDKYELEDLSKSAVVEHKVVLQKMRKLVATHIRNSRDLGFVPLAFKQDQAFADWLPTKLEIQQLHDIAERVSAASVQDVAYFETNLAHPNGIIRFWAAQGFAELAAKKYLINAPKALLKATNDKYAAVATVAREAMVYLQAPGAVESLLAAKDSQHRRSALETIAWTHPNLLVHHLDYFRKNNNGQNHVILAAIGELSAFDVATKKQKKKGISVNQTRRPLDPLPN
ncbi:sulfatase [Paraglaciecola sp. L3A3]|uniref:sulfatase family protein n=1 Tax=Paraglaciecola sp. L3A3 TaxID=2686358 RepID=UPI00131C51AA|nr:sulfatase [Paraglaciecola sp. L3A3]